MKKDVQFYSEGKKIAGDLYLPNDMQDQQPCPAVILCNGFAGIKELLLPAYAERLAQHGLIALIFDYRGFGDSEGERGRLVPQEQVTDIRHAMTFVQTLKEVNGEHIGLWGTSFGGANSIYVASIDTRVKALAVQLTFASGERMITRELREEEREKLESTLRKVRERAVTRNKVLRLNPDQILTDEESQAFYADIVEQYPKVQTKIPFSTLQHIMEHNPQYVIANVTCPILIIAAEKDTVCPTQESYILFEHANEPKKLLMLEGCKHYDAYEGKPFEKGIESTIEWFSRYLNT